MVSAQAESGFVGVVVPAWNRERYIEATLRSIDRQTLRPARIVVVDDGSTDGTASVVKALQADIPELELLHQPNRGPAAARNRGWRHLRDCGFIAFCDSDDLWHPKKLERQMALFRHASDRLGCVYCANDSIDAHGSQLAPPSMPRLRGDVRGPVSQGVPITGSMSAAVVRRKYLEMIDGFDEQFHSDEDLELFIRLSEVCEFDYVEDCLVSIRWHGTNSSADFEKLLRTKSMIINKHFEKYSFNSQFIENRRDDILTHFMIEMRKKPFLPRIIMLLSSPFYYKRAAANFSGRAQTLIYPSMLWLFVWVSGRLLLYFANRMAKSADARVSSAAEAK